MKNLCFLLMIFLLTNIMVGCEEDIIVPAPPVVIDPIVVGTASALPTSIIAGQTTTVTYTAGSKDVTSVTINGTTVPATSGSKPYTLTETTTFTVKFIGPNDKTYETSVVVNVSPDPNKARTDSLCLNKYWKLVSIKALLPDGTWGSDPLSAEQLSSKGFYSPNGTTESFDVNGKLNGNGKWAWYSSNSIIWNNATITPYKLTNDSLILYERNGTIIKTYKWYPL